MRHFLALLFSLSFTQVAFADAETDEAIVEVQGQMQNLESFKKASGDNPQALATQKSVQQLSGGAENEKDIYKLAADVLGNMKGRSPEEIQKILDQAQKDPARFAATFSGDQQKKLEEIANRVPAGKNKRP